MTTHSGPTLSRRSVLQWAGVGAASLALTSCSSQSASSVSWQAIPSYSLQSSDPKRATYLKNALAKFEAGRALKISSEVTSADTAAAMSKLLLQASQHRAADVSQVDGYVFGRMSSYAKPLTSAMARAGLTLEDWIPSLRPIMTAGHNEVRSLQFTSDVRLLYYRKDLVKKPPATWDELVALGKPLAKQGYVTLFPGGRSEGAVTTSLWPQLWNQGAELFDNSGNPAFASGAGYEAMRSALAVVETLVKTGVSPTRVATFGAEDKANTDVVAGRVAMFLGGSWQAATLNHTLPKKDFFTTWGVAPIPSISGEKHVTSAGGWVWAGFSEDQKRLDFGADWVIQAFVSDAGMAAWCTAGGYLPPRAAIYDRPDYKQNPFTPTFREHLTKYARTRPGDRKYLEVSNSMQIALSSVASGATGASDALDQALNRLA